LSEIWDLSGLKSHEPEKREKSIPMFEIGNLRDISKKERVHIVPDPCTSSPGIPPPKHLGISAGQNDLHELVPGGRREAVGGTSCEDSFQKSRSFSPDFSL
jgi:hypothetical protein